MTTGCNHEVFNSQAVSSVQGRTSKEAEDVGKYNNPRRVLKNVRQGFGMEKSREKSNRGEETQNPPPRAVF